MEMKKVGQVTVLRGCTNTMYEHGLPGLNDGTHDLFVMIETAAALAQAGPAPCGCNPAEGIVCSACEVMAEKNVAELSQYVNEFIDKRFPSGLKGDIRRIIVECVLDAFHDGARWAESQPPGEPDLIITDLASPSKLITL